MPDAETMTPIRLKVAVVGAPKVGKTSIVRAWVGRPVPTQHTPTVLEEVVMIQEPFMGDVMLEVHDVPGVVNDEEAAAILADVHAVVMVYDYGRQSFFRSLEDFWVPRVLALVAKNAAHILAANKDFWMRPSPHKLPLDGYEKRIYKSLPSSLRDTIHFYKLDSLDVYADVTLQRVFNLALVCYWKRKQGPYYCQLL